MSAKKIFVMGSMAVMGVAFMACSNESLYDEGAVIKEQEAEYAANFEKRYGKIDPNQNWDFTSDNLVATPSATSLTRATAPGAKPSFDRTKSYMTIPASISEWMFANLPKGNNNTPMGRKFNMEVGENSFGIVPVFQGCASFYWELWMYVDGVGDERVWSKGEELKYKKASDTGFTAVGIGTNGMKSEWGPCQVYAPAYTYSNLPAGAAMEFYLKVWKSHEDFENNESDPLNEAYWPYKTSSLDKMMINLEQCPLPEGLLPEGYTATIIGCEDKIEGSDKDFEDLAFILFGDPVPPTKKVTHKDVARVKRYMMEDLGETDDFDFNDVVIDIYYDRKHYDYYFATVDDEEPYKIDETTLDNLGVVRAAGGILDFKVYVGEKMVWQKSASPNVPDVTDMINTGKGHDTNFVLDTFTPDEFIARNNNISVELKRGNSEGVYRIKFPEAGKAPKMIAVRPGTNWMDERVKVPQKWFYPKN